MYLTSIEISGFKSFGKKVSFDFTTPITAIVGPNGSGKSNSAEAFRFVLGEQSLKSLRGKRGEDLIWGGSSELPRGSRAAVRVVFDNRPVNGARLLGVDYDEVSIERTVYRDGQNEYSINNSKVRLKDVVELLAQANIGASGHHIISQGEADRVLSASPRERRQMVEDALGLRVYQYKKEESKKKLDKTRENQERVESLRKENAPHLAFLKRQVEKIARARELRETLIQAYEAYLVREHSYIAELRTRIAHDGEAPRAEHAAVEKRINHLKAELNQRTQNDPGTAKLLALETELGNAREAANRAVRTLGRLEGQVASEERRLELERARLHNRDERPVPLKEVRGLVEMVDARLTAFTDCDEKQVRIELVTRVRNALSEFLAVFDREERAPDSTELDKLRVEYTQAERAGAEAEKRIVQLTDETGELRTRLLKNKDEDRELERELFTLMARESSLRAAVRECENRAAEGDRLEEELTRELTEAVALIGREALRFKHATAPTIVEERSVQLERRRALEKLKIRLEEMGGANAEEVTKEYEATRQRDEFLVRELADLEASATALTALLADLDRELTEKFRAGVAAISAQFTAFFALMFGGGSATLSVVEERKRKGILGLFEGTDESEEQEQVEAEIGIEIDVSLPKKRVKGLTMLSGGERALTSIALIFAMSQVNPPPFLILDETDAALDEANSKRYGDMIASLSAKSQLILITHNRETMSRAGILYGVTMGADGVSKVLSVKLDEAVGVAK